MWRVGSSLKRKSVDIESLVLEAMHPSGGQLCWVVGCWGVAHKQLAVLLCLQCPKFFEENKKQMHVCVSELLKIYAFPIPETF